MSSSSKYLFYLPLIFLAACVSPSQQPAEAAKKNWQDEIAAAAAKELQESGAPSLQIAVGHDGEVIFEGAYGLADVENDVAATPAARYRTASVSKWLTASAAMILVDQGALDPDVPIQTYCPQFPAKRWPITTRQLLTHTSGIRHYADYEAEFAQANSDSLRDDVERRRTRDQLGTYTRYTDVAAPLIGFKNDALLFEPGSGWTYSSFGYRVLACVMEGAAERPYRTIMKELVFEPAGMTDTVDDDSWAIIPHRVSGYRLVRGEPLRRAEMRDVSENLPAGGHLSTATDLVRFAQVFDSEKLLSTEATTLMSTPFGNNQGQTADSPSWRDAIPSEKNYSYGVMFFPNADGTWIGHTGRQAGASAIIILVPDKNLSIAVMSNVKGWNGYISFTEAIRAIVARELILRAPS